MHHTVESINPKNLRVKNTQYLNKKLRGVHHSAETISAVCITPSSQSLRCASHRKVNICCVHHSVESISAECIIPRTPRSQTVHRGDQIEIFVCLWLLFKGQSGEILLGVNTSTVCLNWWFVAKHTIWTPRCRAYHGVEIFELCDRISWRNWNQIRK